MEIPGFEKFMLPLLRATSREGTLHIREAYRQMSAHFHLSKEQEDLLLPSGKQATYQNRIGWAATFMKKAGLLVRPQRGYLAITDQGKRLLDTGKTSLSVDDLRAYPEFNEFHPTIQQKSEEERKNLPIASQSSPEEDIAINYAQIKTKTSAELLEKVKTMTPAFFERLVVDLVTRMRPGAPLSVASRVLGKSGDQGVDGVIPADNFGFDFFYLQAKRWNNPVGASEVRDFYGALTMKNAAKGLLITTSSFTKDAVDCANQLPPKIKLIDGEKLVDLMWKFQVGVHSSIVYQVNKIDEDYFSDELET